MIRYRKFINLFKRHDDSDIKPYDVVKYAGYEWYVIDVDDKDIVTLLAKDLYFDRISFDGESSNYQTSQIRKFLLSDVLPTDLPDVNCRGDKIWLLSTSEVKNLPVEIRKFPKYWWLRSRGNNDYHNEFAAFVDTNGSFAHCSEKVYYVWYAVRPAIRVHMEDLV